jgi:hypothetical protein
LFSRAAPGRCITHAGLPRRFRNNDGAVIAAFFIPQVLLPVVLPVEKFPRNTWSALSEANYCIPFRKTSYL